MLDENKYINIGEIYREHGVKGHCKFYSYSGTCKNLIVGQKYILFNASAVQKTVTLMSVTSLKQFYIVLFDAFDSPESAKLFRKARLWLDKTLFKKDDALTCDSEYNGFSLFDQSKNKIGLVKKIVRTPLKQLVVVLDSRIKNKIENEVFIPLVDEWVIETDFDNKRLLMELPEGLF